MPESLIVKALRDLTVENLARCPIGRYEGQSDQTASVSRVAAFADLDRVAYSVPTTTPLAISLLSSLGLAS